MNSVLSVIVILCCFTCACSFCCLNLINKLIADLETIIELLAEEDEDE